MSWDHETDELSPLLQGHLRLSQTARHEPELEKTFEQLYVWNNHFYLSMADRKKKVLFVTFFTSVFYS